MFRGTTPSLEFKLPFAVDTIRAINIAFADSADRLLVEKSIDDCVLKGNTVTLKLSQTDTLAFPVGTVNVQMKVRTEDEEALCSRILQIVISKSLKEGEI